MSSQDYNKELNLRGLKEEGYKISTPFLRASMATFSYNTNHTYHSGSITFPAISERLYRSLRLKNISIARMKLATTLSTFLALIQLAVAESQ